WRYSAARQLWLRFPTGFPSQLSPPGFRQGSVVYFEEMFFSLRRSVSLPEPVHRKILWPPGPQVAAWLAVLEECQRGLAAMGTAPPNDRWIRCVERPQSRASVTLEFSLKKSRSAPGPPMTSCCR